MAIGITPIVGSWYQGADELKFEVIAVNEDAGIIEIHYMDGELDEVEFDVWSQMRVEHLPSLGDWGEIYDEFAQDDLDYTDFDLRS